MKVSAWPPTNARDYGSTILPPEVDATGGGGGGTIETQDDGVTVDATADTLNFNYGLTAIDAGGDVTQIDALRPNYYLGLAHYRSWLVMLDGTLSALGIPQPTVTNGALQVATNTSRVTQLGRYRAAVPTTTNSRAMITGADSSRTLWRGNGTGLGGFRITFYFVLETDQANVAFFVGLTSFSTFAYPSTASDAQDMTNTIFVGANKADTDLYVMHNDGSGTCTRVNTGFARASGDMYEITFYAAANAGSIDVTVRQVGGSTFTTSPSTNLPNSTTGMTYGVGGWQSSALGAVAQYALSYVGLSQDEYWV